MCIYIYMYTPLLRMSSEGGVGSTLYHSISSHTIVTRYKFQRLRRHMFLGYISALIGLHQRVNPTLLMQGTRCQIA